MKVKNNLIVELDESDYKTLIIPKEAHGFDFGTFEYHGFFGQLQSIEVEAGNPVLYVKDGCLMRRDGTLLIAANGAKIPADGSVKSIFAFAFNMVESIKGDIRIPDGVEEIIGARAFGGSDINKIYIPASVKTIHGGAFAQQPETCMQIVVDGANPCYYTQGGCLIERATMSVVSVFGNDITIPEGIKSIEDYVFLAYSFEKIVIPASVEYIGSVNFITIGDPEIIVKRDSYAEKYLKDKKISYSLAE